MDRVEKASSIKMSVHTSTDEWKTERSKI